MLPPIRVNPLDQKSLRATVAIAINTHLHGAVTMAELSAWALKCFHAIHQQPHDDDDDTADDEDELNHTTSVIDADLFAILDELMFADHPDLAPSHATLQQWATQLMR